MKLVLSFDDGRADNMRVFDEILAPRNIPATMNISTAYVDGTISDGDRPCPNPAMSVDDVKRLAASPIIELAGHGDKHLNTPEDLAEGLRKLRSWVSCEEAANTGDPEQATMTLMSTDIIGIASPHSELTAEEVLAQRTTYEAMGVEYVRIGPGATYSGFNRLAGKISRIVGGTGAFKKAFSGVDLFIEGSFVLESIPVMHSVTLDQVQALVTEKKEQASDVILMFHSILKPGEEYYDDDWSWDYDCFKALIKWVSETPGIDIVTTQQAFRGDITR